jgi:S-adenosylmethionine-diacylglycerol 3-amino-3-carboxypropyl transferase
MNQERWVLHSISNKDSNSEIQALNISPSDTVLCVTGSGCHALSLLARNPKHLISVDHTPGQNYLLELKLAAIRNLSYKTLLQFFGIEDSHHRWDIFCLIEDRISLKAAAYFRANRWAVERGILWLGRHELFYIRFTVPLIRLLYGKIVENISTVSFLAEQKLYKKYISSLRLHYLMRIEFSLLVLRLILNEPKYFIEMNVNEVAELIKQLHRRFTHHLMKDKHWTSLLFYSRHLKRNYLPHFLLEKNYLAIRNAKTEVEIVTDNLLDYMKRLPEQSINKYSLSNATSFLNKDSFEELISEVVRTSTNPGWLCYRNFLNKQPIPSKFNDVIQRSHLVSSLLDRDDLVFAYTFEFAAIKAIEKLSESINNDRYYPVNRG